MGGSETPQSKRLGYQGDGNKQHGWRPEGSGRLSTLGATLESVLHCEARPEAKGSVTQRIVENIYLNIYFSTQDNGRQALIISKQI